MIYKSPRYFLSSFQSVGSLIQEEFKIDFQDGSHPGFPLGTILFWSASHPDTSYQVSSQLASRFKRRFNIHFQDGCHFGFPTGTILAIFDLQIAQILHTKFWVNWPFGSWEEVQNRFSRWLHLRASWISNRNGFSYFWSALPWYFLPSFKSRGLSVQEKKPKINFQDGQMATMAAILDFW